MAIKISKPIVKYKVAAKAESNLPLFEETTTQADAKAGAAKGEHSNVIRMHEQIVRPEMAHRFDLQD